MENRRAMWRLWGRPGEEEEYTEFWCGYTKRKGNLEEIGVDETVIKCKLKRNW
jgi:hypothetical protein